MVLQFPLNLNSMSEGFIRLHQPADQYFASVGQYCGLTSQRHAISELTSTFRRPKRSCACKTARAPSLVCLHALIVLVCMCTTRECATVSVSFVYFSPWILHDVVLRCVAFRCYFMPGRTLLLALCYNSKHKPNNHSLTFYKWYSLTFDYFFKLIPYPVIRPALPELLLF